MSQGANEPESEQARGFIIYINDLIESCRDDAKIYLFADDARLYNHIKCIMDAEILQSKNDKFTDWAHRWLVKLSTKKCKLMSFHQRHYDTTTIASHTK